MITVAIKPLVESDPIQYGVFHGLVSNTTGCDRCDGDGYSVAVTIDGHGMIISLIHPSRVVIIRDRNEYR